MPVSEIRILIWSNNPLLEDYFLHQKFISDLKIEKYKKDSSAPYVFVLIDISSSLEDISQKIISTYESVKSKNQKLAVVLVHPISVDNEKNIYFANLLDSLGSKSPLHRLVFVRDLYHPDLLSSETPLEKYIIETLAARKATVSPKGDKELYPLTLSDFLQGLKKIFFLNSTAGKNFWMLGEPVTDLELAYLIKKNLEDSEGPEFEIDADKEHLKSTLDLSSLGNQTRALLNWMPKDEFLPDLKETVKKVNVDQSLLISKIHELHRPVKVSTLQKLLGEINEVVDKISNLKSKKGTLKPIENAPQLLRKALEYILIFGFTAYLLLSISFIGFSALSLKELESAMNFVRKTEIDQSVASLNRSIVYSRLGESSYATISPVFNLVSPNFHSKNYNLFIFLHYAQSSLENLQQTYQLAEKLYKAVGTDVAANFYTDTGLALQSNLGQIYENLNQLELLTGQNKLPKILEDRLRENTEFKNLKLVEQQIIQLTKASELIPSFFAGDEVKNVVALFQNSKEVRSTGGAINYLLVLVLQKGKVVSRNLYSTEELDRLVEGAVASPPLIEQFTGSEDWNFRDLNYNPDYPQTAANVSWLLEKALKLKPDIVMSATDLVFKDFLEEEKGLVLDGQRVVPDTLNEQLHERTPSSLYRQLIIHYLDRFLAHEISLTALGRIIAKQSESNHLLFWAQDPNIEKAVINQPYSGAVYPHACHSAITSVGPCLAQTTYLNESNFSLIPLGDKLIRHVLHNVRLENAMVTHQYRLSYEFKEEIAPSVNDLDIVFQLYTPLKSTLGQINLDGKPISLKGITEQEDHALTRYQIPVSMSYNQKHELVINFSTEVAGRFTPPFGYALTEYHQPGIREGIELNLNFPEFARPVLLTSPVQSRPNSLNLVLPPMKFTFGGGFTINE